jgi:hypothetical protein
MISIEIDSPVVFHWLKRTGIGTVVYRKVRESSDGPISAHSPSMLIRLVVASTQQI